MSPAVLKESSVYCLLLLSLISTSAAADTASESMAGPSCPALAQVHLSKEEASGNKPVVESKPATNQPATAADRNDPSEVSPVSKPSQPKPADATPGQVHRVQMRLSGSSCLSCLAQLEKTLKGLPGITKAKIEFPGETLQFYNLSGATWALATITYDPSKRTLASMIDLIAHQGYHAYKVVDKTL